MRKRSMVIIIIAVLAVIVLACFLAFAKPEIRSSNANSNKNDSYAVAEKAEKSIIGGTSFSDDVFESNEGGIGTDSEDVEDDLAANLDVEISGMDDDVKNNIKDYDGLILDVKKYMLKNGDIGKDITFNGVQEKDGKKIYRFTSASGHEFEVEEQ